MKQTETTLFIDPPSGWQYGFPKMAPKNLREMTENDIETWFVSNGYPQSEVDYWKNSKFKGIPFRVFED